MVGEVFSEGPLANAVKLSMADSLIESGLFTGADTWCDAADDEFNRLGMVRLQPWRPSHALRSVGRPPGERIPNSVVWAAAERPGAAVVAGHRILRRSPRCMRIVGPLLAASPHELVRKKIAWPNVLQRQWAISGRSERLAQLWGSRPSSSRAQSGGRPTSSMGPQDGRASSSQCWQCPPAAGDP